MINSLKIHNLIHFEDVEMTFDPGLTIITGESGAGKSVIINALQTLAGKSIPPSWVAKSGQTGFIEGLFEITAPSPELDDYLDETNLLVVRRYLTEGKSAIAQLNGQTVTLKLLKTLISPLISATTQHQQVALLDSSFIISLLDQNTDRPFEVEFITLLEQRRQLSQQLEAISKGTNLAQHRAFLEFQIAELADLTLVENEDTFLKEKKDRIQKMDKEIQAVQKLKYNLDQIQELVTSTQRIVTPLVPVEGSNSAYSILDSGLIEMILQGENLAQTLGKIESDLSGLEGEDIEEIESRLDVLFRIKTKYNLATTDLLIAHQKALESELFAIENNAQSATEIQSKLAHTLSRLSEIGTHWAQRRNQAAAELVDTLKTTLLKIGFPYVAIAFSVQFDENQLGTDGGSAAEIKLSTSPSRAPEALAKIASGGELSRIFLAITATLTPQSQQTLVFDEIDAGIGGTTANEVGALIQSLSDSSQIICITHLPQIAKFSKTHYVVSKRLSLNDIIGKVDLLSDEHKHEELKRMIGGSAVLSQIDPH